MCQYDILPLGLKNGELFFSTRRAHFSASDQIFPTCVEDATTAHKRIGGIFRRPFHENMEKVGHIYAYRIDNTAMFMAKNNNNLMDRFFLTENFGGQVSATV